MANKIQELTAASLPLVAGNEVWVEQSGLARRVDVADLGGAITALTSLNLPQDNSPTAPTLSFGDGNTGFYESSDNVLNVANAGVNQFNWFSNEYRGSNAGSGFMLNQVATNLLVGIGPASSDTTTGLGLNAANELSLIAGGKEMLRLVETGVNTTDQLIIGPAGIIGAVATPALAFGDGDSGFYESADDDLRVSLAGIDRWRWTGSEFQGNATGAAQIRNLTATATVPTLIPSRGDTDTGVGSGALNQIDLIVGAETAFRGIKDGASEMYFNNNKRIVAEAAGLLSIYSDTTGPTSISYIKFLESDGDRKGQIGFGTGSESFAIRSWEIGGFCSFVGTAAGDVTSNFLNSDPDGPTNLGYDRSWTARTAAAATGGWEIDNDLTGGGFERALTESDVGITATTAELAQDTDAINTDPAKVEGYMVFNTTTNIPVWAAGNGDTDVWVNATGATAHTPV